MVPARFDPRAMHAAEGVKNSHLQPTNEQLAVGDPRETTNIGSDKGVARERQALTLDITDFKMLPGRLNITGPCRTVTLRSGISRTSDHKWTLLRQGSPNTILGRTGHLHPIDIVGLPVGARMAIEIVTNITRKSLFLIENSRFVHVRPDPGQATLLHERGKRSAHQSRTSGWVKSGK